MNGARRRTIGVGVTALLVGVVLWSVVVMAASSDSKQTEVPSRGATPFEWTGANGEAIQIPGGVAELVAVNDAEHIISGGARQHVFVAPSLAGGERCTVVILPDPAGNTASTTCGDDPSREGYVLHGASDGEGNLLVALMFSSDVSRPRIDDGPELRVVRGFATAKLTPASKVLSFIREGRQINVSLAKFVG